MKLYEKEYLEMWFHPRTYNGKAQLHTERVIFSHIDFLDNYRMFVIGSDFEKEFKDTISKHTLEVIAQYLDLYSDNIEKFDRRRKVVADELICNDLCQAPN